MQGKRTYGQTMSVPTLKKTPHYFYKVKFFFKMKFIFMLFVSN